MNDYRSLYLFKTESGRVKIGISKQVEKRKRQLECQSGHKIVDVWCSPVTPNAKVIEQLLHLKYARYRVKGEWFVNLDYDDVKQYAERLDYSNQRGIY